MLYISRRIDGVVGAAGGNYGVVDTDDETETLVDFYNLHHICCDLGIEVKGVRLTFDSRIKQIEEVVPYQPDSTMTLCQIKTAILSHVYITVFRDLITTIHCDYSAIKTPVSVRLSDFGSKVGDYCLLFRESCAEHVLTLILDDKLEITNKSFCVYAPFFVEVMDMGVKFDLRDVKYDDRAKVIYDCVLRSRSSADQLSAIIDIDSRYKKYKDDCLF